MLDMINTEKDEEQQSLLHAHELINAQDEQIQLQAAKIQQQAAVVEEQATLTKRLEEKLKKVEEALKRPRNVSSFEAFCESGDLISNQDTRKKQKWLYDLGKKKVCTIHKGYDD